MSILSYPWEEGIRPLLINEEGFEWYEDDHTTSYAQNRLGKNYVVLFVKKNDFAIRVLMNKNNGKILAEDQGLEGIGSKIDILQLQLNSKFGL
jgi:hypothetical protein